jgi:hypothetical protein
VNSFPYGAVRTTLITSGVAAFTYLFTRPGSIEPSSPGGEGFVLAGVCVQLALWVLQALIRARIPEPDVQRQALVILELAGDGVTVFLFALGVFRGISAATEVL